MKGKVLDVAVDIRKGSPAFGKHVKVELSEENHRQFFIQREAAHGFIVLSEEAVYHYKCDNSYAPPTEEGNIAWNDSSLAIDWQIPTENIILSEKDKDHPTFDDCYDLFDCLVDYFFNRYPNDTDL